ncbi:hypothetical protein ACRWQL_13350 [Shewanella sp. HL-SH4]
MLNCKQKGQGMTEYIIVTRIAAKEGGLDKYNATAGSSIKK